MSETGIFVSAVIVAAGLSTRMESGTNKNFMQAGSETVLGHTLDAFLKTGHIDQIIVAYRHGELECARKAAYASGLNEVTFVEGGDSRQESVFNALKACDTRCDVVVIHDAARCCVTPEMIRTSVKAAREHGAAVCALKTSDTCCIAEDGKVSRYVDRSLMYQLQTPQTFRYELIMRAHEEARKEAFEGTDDTSLVRRLGEDVFICEGSAENIKITTKDDLKLAVSILAAREDK